ncbi:MAG TPA: maltose alpha-D-glucosyltransferase [bacterium]
MARRPSARVRRPVLTRPGPADAPERDPLWYKDAVIYELHVRAFFDSNGDGIGDFRGLTAKLDYLRDLGVTAIWVLPFYPSPLKDDGYDIADYTDVHPAYGTLRDFREFVREAHRRGLRVITELVCNHTSDQHPWFQRARAARPGSTARRFYVWSDDTTRYTDARVIFKDFETSNWTWDPVAGAYYWHRFYTHQPDLNFEHPRVRAAILKVLEFWLDTGVDGLRLDAVPYLYEREGTNCENLPETHDFLKELRRHVDRHYADRMILAEANQWPEDAAAYFGAGDECHMAFHFPLMPRMFMALRMEDRFPVLDILRQTPAIPASAQWALFLRNHDELTLEMVTDEERDYMYRVYAHDPAMRINLGIRRRLAPLLGNHRRRIELMTGLLFSLPGTPVIYYGDEIGMGDNIFLGDRNSVRTPMQWSGDRNAGFSSANRQRLYLPVIVDPEYHFETLNVEVQQNNPHSLLWWTKRLIALRRQHRAFGRGSLHVLQPENPKVLAFVRRLDDELILVVCNLSRFVQGAAIDLHEFRGAVPVEMFGRVEFPPVTDASYFFTLGPHAFYWFSLEQPRTDGLRPLGRPIRITLPAEASLSVDGPAGGPLQQALAAALPPYLASARWFAGKARRVKAVRVADTVPVPSVAPGAGIVIATVDYTDGDPETYALPVAVAAGAASAGIAAAQPQAVIAELTSADHTASGVIYDALIDPAFCRALLDAIGGRRHLRSARGEIVAAPTRAFRRVAAGAEGPITLIRSEQTNSSVVYGDRLIMKLFRRLEPGINPDVDVGRFLTEHGFAHTPAVAGVLEYRSGGAHTAVAILQQFVRNQGDAWQYTQDSLHQFFDQVMSAGPAGELPAPSAAVLVDRAETDLPQHAGELLGAYRESARLLGQRTAELHQTLASDRNAPEFAPEPVTMHYQRSMYQSMRNLLSRVLAHAGAQRAAVPGSLAADLREVGAMEEAIGRRFAAVLEQRITASRIRIHGDYHLGQVLYTGKDFVIIDFEGEPSRPLGERRMKRLALRDVAGMIRSFHYAAYTALVAVERSGLARGETLAALERWAEFWSLWTSATFLRSYLLTAGTAPFIPGSRRELTALLDALLLEKAVYELGYELNHRPAWVPIPLRGITQLMRG